MEKTKAIISLYQTSHMEFKYYFSVIEIAEDSINEKPDITIDCCKALIEGLSKSILIKLDNNYNKNNKLVDGVKAKKLFDKAIKFILRYDQSLTGKETEFLSKSSELVDILINIRNDRGDISHGKFTPKPNDIISTSEFASLVLNVTDSIVSFMLNVFFKLKIPSSGLIDYHGKDMEDYNNWLDESVYFPIKKARYSRLLFENDYDEYESRYSDEYLKSEEEETDHRGFGEVNDEAERVETVMLPELAEKAAVVSVEVNKEAPSGEKRFRKLVVNFDQESFWTVTKNKALYEFAEEENLKEEDLKDVINKYLKDEKPPLRDDVAKTMVNKPKVKERRNLVPSLTDRIMAFANDLCNSDG